MRWILSVLLLAACTPHIAGLEPHELDVDGARRSYQLFVPDSIPQPAPLVVALHRFTENGALMAQLTGLNDVAEREGFVVVYPDGPGRRFEAFDEETRDDSVLVLAVIENVAQQMPIDRARIYLTGASNGGFMTHRLACRHPEIFAAAAPVMALMPAQLAERVPDGAPVPMLMIHGTEDGIVEEDATSVFAGASYAVLPMEETVDYWVRRNRSRRPPTRERLSDSDPEDGTRIERLLYAAGAAETVYYRVEGGGHTWPRGEERAPGFIVGRTSQDISASEVIWEFFARHERQDKRDVGGGRESGSVHLVVDDP